MNRLHDLIARIVVGAAWWGDRVTCQWANESHLPMEGEE